VEPPKELMLQLKAQYALEDFIETGTYRGGTAVWAAAHFARVTTVEFSRALYEDLRAQHDGIGNVRFIFGDSREALKAILPKLDRPALFWLDSHWSGGRTYGENDECPLLEEIEAIVSSAQTHFLFIDDARLFASPPPRPHRIEQWPTIGQVIGALTSAKQRYYIVILEDVIIAVPEYARALVAGYCQEVNTRVWQESGSAQGNVVQRILRKLAAWARGAHMRSDTPLSEGPTSMRSQ
jgi:hypothetical protein